MRYPKDHRAETQARIVRTASSRFRGEGIGAVGVASLMQSAGLTHGGFYAHFAAKDELVAVALAEALDDTLGQLRAQAEAQPAGQRLWTLIEAYVSPLHRDHPSAGCVLSALLGELPRQPDAVRQAMAGKLQTFVTVLDDLARADGLEVEGHAVLALMAGAVALSRLPCDANASQAFLDGAKTLLRRSLAPRAPER